jgi:hypothetical protein
MRNRKERERREEREKEKELAKEREIQLLKEKESREKQISREREKVPNNLNNNRRQHIPDSRESLLLDHSPIETRPVSEQLN